MAVKAERTILNARDKISAALTGNMRALDQFELEMTAVWASNVSRAITRELRRRRHKEARAMRKVVEHGAAD